MCESLRQSTGLGDYAHFAGWHEVESIEAGTPTSSEETTAPALEMPFQLTYSYEQGAGDEAQHQTATIQSTVRTLEPSSTRSAVRAILVEKLPGSTGPGDNAIKQRTISIFGRQESGKSNTTRYVVEEALLQYGRNAVNVQVAKGEHFRELLEPDCWTKQPVQIIVLEDITFCKIDDDVLRDFFRIREIMQRNSERRDGLCIVLFTGHTFFQTPKSFRTNCDGLIALSAPWEEYDRNYLSRRIGRDNLEFLEQAELRESADQAQRAAVMIYRNMKPMRLEIPRIKPEESFMYRMEQCWKQKSEPLQANSQVTYHLNLDGECARRYGLSTPSVAGLETSETQTLRLRSRIAALHSSLKAPKNVPWMKVAFLVLSATLVFAFAPRLLGSVALLLVLLAYATSAVLALRETSRWMKVKLKR